MSRRESKLKLIQDMQIKEAQLGQKGFQTENLDHINQNHSIEENRIKKIEIM